METKMIAGIWLLAGAIYAVVGLILKKAKKLSEAREETPPQAGKEGVSVEF